MWVRVPGPVNELQQEERVHVAGGFGPDGLRPPARGDSDRDGTGRPQSCLHASEPRSCAGPEGMEGCREKSRGGSGPDGPGLIHLQTATFPS